MSSPPPPCLAARFIIIVFSLFVSFVRFVRNCARFFFSSSRFRRNDFLRRRKYYISDWTDAFEKKRLVIPAVLFLYFACLAPAVSFGTIASEITNGSMGVVEFLLGSGVAGMVSFI